MDNSAPPAGLPPEQPGAALAGDRRETEARSRPRGLRPRWIVAVVLVVVAAWAAITAVDLLLADRHLRAGMATAEQARQGLNAQSLETGLSRGDVAVAADDFAAAHAEISRPWFTPLRFVPILGTQIRSLSALSGAADTVASSGDRTLTSVHALLDTPRTTPSERATVVEHLAVSLRALSTQVADLHFGPSRGLIGTLATKRTTFVEDVGQVQTGLDKATGAAAALADVLRGPRTYLLAATNNAEMRAGSGMMLQAGTIHIAAGRFTLGHFVATGSLVDTATRVRATGDLEARWGFEYPSVDFRELLLSPQFPANASLAARMWQERTGRPVDGVLTVDVAALQDLLGATGPITVGGTSYTQATVANQLLIQQYVGIRNQSAANLVRHQKQAELAAAVFSAIDNGSTSLSTLATAFDQAVDGRHLMVWAADPRVESDWAAAGAAGNVSQGDLLLALLNQGANKLDPYQHVTAKLTTTADGDRTAVTARVTVDNQTPASVRGYAAGGAHGAPPARQYTGAVSLDFPATASTVTTSGGRLEAVGPDGASQVVAVAIAVPRGRSITVTFRFEVNGSSGALTVLPSARLPPTTWSWPAGGLTFTDDTAHTVSW
jgi:hypothetical protein